MFTGIVAAVGRIEEVRPSGADPAAGAREAGAADGGGAGAGVRIVVDAGALDLSDVVIGDSIAIQGACMTVTGIDGRRLSFDVSAESLSKTTGLGAPGEVNLEKALTLADRLGGHLVSGHVDGIAEVVAFEPVGESRRLVVRADGALRGYFAYKGSVTLDGVSLTVNEVIDSGDTVEFVINLVPHTIEVTTLRSLHPGRRMNLEIDLIARYVERMLGTGRMPE